jgi:Tol biopolymer transport system component
LLKLTNLAESEFNPVWSPDGTQIAFLVQSSEADEGIYLISSMGGLPRKIFTPHNYVHWEQGALSWSPDGKSLLFPDTADSQVVSSIYQLPLDTLQPHAITHPPAEWEGDMSPVFSPDGKKIAFIRAMEGGVNCPSPTNAMPEAILPSWKGIALIGSFAAKLANLLRVFELPWVL